MLALFLVAASVATALNPVVVHTYTCDSELLDVMRPYDSNRILVPSDNTICTNRTIENISGLGLTTVGGTASDSPLDPVVRITPQYTYLPFRTSLCRTVEVLLSLETLPRGRYALFDSTDLTVVYTVVPGFGTQACLKRYIAIPAAGQRLNEVTVDLVNFQLQWDTTNDFLENGQVYQLTLVEKELDLFDVCIGGNGFKPYCVETQVGSTWTPVVDPVITEIEGPIGTVYYVATFDECTSKPVISTLFDYLPLVGKRNPRTQGIPFDPELMYYPLGPRRTGGYYLALTNEYLAVSDDERLIEVFRKEQGYWKFDAVVECQGVRSLALSDSNLLAGAPDYTDSYGQVCVFTRVNGLWNRVRIDSPADERRYGLGVTIQGIRTAVLTSNRIYIDGYVTPNQFWGATYGTIQFKDDVLVYHAGDDNWGIRRNSTGWLEETINGDTLSVSPILSVATNGTTTVLCRTETVLVFTWIDDTSWERTSFFSVPCSSVSLNSHSVFVDGSVYTPGGTLIQVLRYGQVASYEDDEVVVADGSLFQAYMKYTPPPVPPTPDPGNVQANYVLLQSVASGTGDAKFSGDVLAIGDRSYASNTGGVWVYYKTGSTYTLATTLAPLVGTLGVNAQRGTKIALTSTSLLFSGESDDSNRGAIWYFERISLLVWAQRRGRVRLPFPFENDRFGSCLVLLDAPNAIVGASGRGEVYRFNTQTGTVTFLDTAPELGLSCSGSGMTYAVAGTNYVRVYRDFIQEDELFFPSDTVHSVALQGTRLVIATSFALYTYERYFSIWVLLDTRVVVSYGISLDEPVVATREGVLYNAYTLDTLQAGLPSSSRVAVTSTHLLLGDTLYTRTSPAPSRAPTRSPTLSAPTQSPVISTPTTSPVTKSPTTATPTSQAPSLAPTTSRPSRNPTTSRPSLSPVITKAPSSSPVPATKSPTSQPSSSPVVGATKSPTSQSPTSQAPSLAPTTSRPSRSPSVTFTPLFAQYGATVIPSTGSTGVCDISSDGLYFVSGSYPPTFVTFYKRGVTNYAAIPSSMPTPPPFGTTQMGEAVAMNNAGTRAVAVGDAGIVIYTRSVDTWTATASVAMSGIIGMAGYRLTAVMSTDGAIVVAGRTGDNGERGAFFSFQESGGTWSGGTKYTAVTTNLFGIGLALNRGNDSILVVSSSTDFRIYTRSGSTWVLEGSAYSLANIAEVGISNDAEYVWVGAPYNSANSMYLYKRTTGYYYQVDRYVHGSAIGYFVVISSFGFAATASQIIIFGPEYQPKQTLASPAADGYLAQVASRGSDYVVQCSSAFERCAVFFRPSPTSSPTFAPTTLAPTSRAPSNSPTAPFTPSPFTLAPTPPTTQAPTPPTTRSPTTYPSFSPTPPTTFAPV